MTKPLQRGFEWMMSEYFHLVVRYPADQQLVLVLLVTRGVTSAGRLCVERAAFLLVLAKARCYAERDVLMPYGSLVAE